MSRMRKPDLLLQNLMDFQKDRDSLDRLLRCIDDNHPEHVSIRNIEFGITKFSKRRNAVHEITTPEGSLRYFNIYLQYKSQLKAQNKELFDPFARRERVRFEQDTVDGEKKFLLTTIGQLNFFRWFITNQLQSFIDDNLVDIEWENNQEARAKRRAKKNTRRTTGESTSSNDSGSSLESSGTAVSAVGAGGGASSPTTFVTRRPRRRGDGRSGCEIVNRPTIVSF